MWCLIFTYRISTANHNKNIKYNSLFLNKKNPSFEGFKVASQEANRGTELNSATDYISY